MKQLTRSISMFLVCVMSLCLLTACGGSSGGGGNNNDRDYNVVKAAGASASIEQNDTLENLADAYAEGLKDLAEGKIDSSEYVERLTELATALTPDLVKMDITYYCAAIGVGTTETEADTLTEFFGMDGKNIKLTSSQISSMKYYGVSRTSATNAKTGKTAYITIAVFAR